MHTVFDVLHLFIICLFVYALVLHGNVRYCMLTMMVMASLHNRSVVSPRNNKLIICFQTAGGAPTSAPLQHCDQAGDDEDGGDDVDQN